MIHIVTDSTAHMTPQEIQDNDITVVPLQVTDKGKTYRDDIDITREAFSERLKSDEEFPTTSQPPMGAFIAAYENIFKKDPKGTIISIHISDALSGTLNTAEIAGVQVKGDVRVINSHSGDRGIAHAVLKASKLAKENKSVKQIIQGTNNTINNTKAYIFISNLDYLVKGGRANKAMGMIGSIIRLKPVFSLDIDGFNLRYKCHGTKQLQKIEAKVVNEIINDPSIKQVGIPYVDSRKEVNKISNQICEERPDIKITVGLVAPSIMVHAGPGGFGLIY